MFLLSKPKDRCRKYFSEQAFEAEDQGRLLTYYFQTVKAVSFTFLEIFSSFFNIRQVCFLNPCYIYASFKNWLENATYCKLYQIEFLSTTKLRVFDSYSLKQKSWNGKVCFKVQSTPGPVGRGLLKKECIPLERCEFFHLHVLSWQMKVWHWWSP